MIRKVRYASIAAKLCGATKRRYVPLPADAPQQDRHKKNRARPSGKFRLKDAN
jgi:hypothetical protein